MSEFYGYNLDRPMTQKGFVLTDWVRKLTDHLEDLVNYERSLEHTLADLRRRDELMLGLPISTQEDWTENIRGRVDRYSMGLGSQPRQASGYENGVSGRLNVILGVLREHPALDQAIYTADDQLVLKLDLGIHRVAGHPLVFLLRGLVDYAAEHTPKVATEAFARVVQYEENEGLTFYSMMTLRGLHVEGIHEIASGISLMSWQETRKYMPDTIIRSEINALEGVGGEPIGAVVSPTKWRPVFVHADYDIEKRTWPERSPSFRDDALLFIELIAVTHGSPVRSSGFTYDGVEQEVEHLVGRSPSFGFSRGIVRDDRSNVRVSNTPEMSTKAFVEAVRLFAKMRNEKGRLRLALSRLASSLNRTGPLGSIDSIIDVAIALELMYQPPSTEITYRLMTRASCFLGESVEDRIVISENMRTFYRERSSIVHGSTEPNGKTFEAGFDVARRTLSKLVSEGGPSKTRDWDQFVIAGRF